MKTISDIKNYQQLKDKYPDVVNYTDIPYISDNTEIFCVSYKYGESVFDGKNFNFPKEINEFYQNISLIPIGIVIYGCIEIFDKNRCIDHIGYAYRPIRTVMPGECINEFTIMNKAFDKNSLHSGRSGETWELHSGINSIYCTKLITPAQISSALTNIMGVTPRITCHALSEALIIANTAAKYEAIIAFWFIDPDDINKEPAIFLPLIASSYRHSKAYRISINAFNYERLIELKFPSFSGA